MNDRTALKHIRDGQVALLFERLLDARDNERHMNHKETMYWLQQYKMIARDAVDLLLQRCKAVSNVKRTI